MPPAARRHTRDKRDAAQLRFTHVFSMYFACAIKASLGVNRFTDAQSHRGGRRLGTPKAR
jgi:hypothetical protein